MLGRLHVPDERLISDVNAACEIWSEENLLFAVASRS